MSSRANFAAAADELATRVLSALRGAEDTAFIARHFHTAPDALAALAAIRVIGADAFTPHVLTGVPFHTEDAAAVAQSFDAFPASVVGSPAPGDGGVVAWRDWATGQLLTRFGGERAPGTDAPPPTAADALTDTGDWQQWSVRMAQLASLATPGLDGPVHEAARGAALSLSRGVTRSLLRRDYSTAVRLIRWLAWLHHEGVALPLDPVTTTEHVRILGGTGPRAAVDLAVARHLLEGQLPQHPQDPEAVRR
ncbi:hypothetical protein [Streptomyces sp. NPDC005955]|uniref:hypothetical protein n=1 Tax=Streptomyces sp. NPDC005955 TaxID=3364738 RepID=UPI003699E7C8